MMDDSPIDSNDPTFGLDSLATTSSYERYPSATTTTAAHNGMDHMLSYGLSAFDTVSPSSLDISWSAHDDSCVDNCGGLYNTHGHGHRGAHPVGNHTRSRFGTSSISHPMVVPDTIMSPLSLHNFDLSYPYLGDMDSKNFLTGDERGHSLPFSPHNPMQFNFPSIGTMQPSPAPDDAASVACSMSCTSQCCPGQACPSEACHDEVCVGDDCDREGTPCDDAHCLPCDDINCLTDDAATFAADGHNWALPDNWSQPLPALHDHDTEHCNHTTAEHDVAMALGGLRAPAAQAIPPSQVPYATHFDRKVYSDLSVSFDFTKPQLQISRASPDTEERDILPKGSSKTRKSIPSSVTTKHLTCLWVNGVSNGHEHICGKICANEVELTNHLETAHASLMDSKTKYLCKWKGCSRRPDQTFASRNKLKRHLTSHTDYKAFKCPTCGDGFSAQQALDQHIRTHTGERPFKCKWEGCDRSFKQASALTMHMRTHTGEKPLSCDICGMRFSESSNLSKHRKTHNPVYNFKCKEPGCGKGFVRLDQLRRHEAQHRERKKKVAARLQASRRSPSDSTAASSEAVVLSDMAIDEDFDES